MAFEFENLTTWNPAPCCIPETVTVAQFKRALHHQGHTLSNPDFRRDLMYRLAVGGMSERPYGELDSRGYPFRKRVGHGSAQARSRLLSQLFEIDMADSTSGPLPDRVLAALNLMASAFYGDVDWEHRGHRDFHRMLASLYQNFTGPEIKRHATDLQAYQGRMLDQSAEILELEGPAGCASVSALAGAKILGHAYGDNIPIMLGASPDGTRRLWRWLSLVMFQENEDPSTPNLGEGRSAMRFNSGLPGTNWTHLLEALSYDPVLDSSAIAVLSRFQANAGPDGRHLQGQEKESLSRVMSALHATTRAQRALTSESISESSSRRRHRP